MNGTIGFEEFLDIMRMRPCEKDSEQDIQDNFDKIDLDFKGYIDEDDLLDLAREFNEPEPSKQLLTIMKQELGADHLGRISLKNFKNFCNNRMNSFNLQKKNSYNKFN